MSRRVRQILVSLAAAAAVGLAGPPGASVAQVQRVGLAQDQGAAVITSPLDGAVVSGRVAIAGTATHPQFQRYELAFGYSPNPTDTWFALQPPATSQVVNGLLGQWDTAGISDGTYTLRLRVYWAERAFLEAFVSGVRVQNETPTPAPTEATATEPPLPLPGPATATPTFAATSAQPVILLPPSSTPRPTADSVSVIGGGAPAGAGARFNFQAVGQAFVYGVRFTLAAFVLIGVYAGVRAALRFRR